MNAILTSDKPDKQVFIIFRLSYLGSLGIQLFAAPLAIPDQENKIILALSGEKSNRALRCLVTEAKPLQSDRSDCTLAMKQLQKITELAESFKALYPYHSLEITGYSYSGAVAQVVMLTSESLDRAYIFNSFGIHPSRVKGQSEDKLANIHHSYIEGSFLYGHLL